MRYVGVAVLAAVMVLLLAPRQTAAQALIRLTGDMELGVGQDTTRTQEDTSSSTFQLGGHVAPNLDGWIWSPRFLAFSLSGAYRRDQTTFQTGDSSVIQTEPYRLRINVFPEATHSFELRASRTEIDRTFSIETNPLTSSLTETREEEALTWRLRGGPRSPEASVEVRRERIVEDTIEGQSSQELVTLEMRARQNFTRAHPQLSYAIQHLNLGGVRASFQSPVNTGEGFSHTLSYDDQIRLGTSSLLAPSAFYRISADGSQTANVGGRLASPLSPTIDGNTGARYTYQESPGTTPTHTLSSDSVLTKRVSPTFTLTLGTNSVTVKSDTFIWSQGAFGGASATLWTGLQAAADFGAQVSGGDQGSSQNYRGHMGVVSTQLPRFTLGADYFINFATATSDEQEQQQFLSHNASLVASTTLVPLTTLTASYNLSLQEGQGDQQRHTAALSAAVTPLPFATLQAGVDGYRQSSTGGGRESVDEMAYGVEGGLSVTPAPWLSLSLFGRRAVQEVDHGGQRTEFVSEVARGTAAVTFGNFQLTAEGFVDREPAVELSRWGVRGTLAYKFRVWTFSLDAEHSRFSTAGVESDRDRFMFRIGRSVNALWRWY